MNERSEVRFATFKKTNKKRPGKGRPYCNLSTLTKLTAFFKICSEFTDLSDVRCALAGARHPKRYGKYHTFLNFSGTN